MECMVSTGILGFPAITLKTLGNIVLNALSVSKYNRTFIHIWYVYKMYVDSLDYPGDGIRQRTDNMYSKINAEVE